MEIQSIINFFDNHSDAELLRYFYNFSDFKGDRLRMEILREYSINEIQKIIDKVEIRVGDEVEEITCKKRGYVTHIEDSLIDILCIDGKFFITEKDNLKKTGRFDNRIPTLFKDLQKEKEKKKRNNGN
jgi:hypothetical protein